MTTLKLERLPVGFLQSCIYWTQGDNLPCSDVLIAQAADKWCQENQHAPFPQDILRPEFQKPRFIHASDVGFSISHSGDCWICAIGNHPVGIDLQLRQRVNASGIARRHFHPLEALWLENHPDDFFHIWTAKEACVKYTGQGIDNDFGSFSVVDAHGFKAKVNNVSLHFIPFLDNYVLAIAE